jgi:hypothetical protein
MRVFFAVSPGDRYIGFLHKNNVENMLISFHFIKNPRKLIEYMKDYTPKNLIIDSGAFSVWSNGGTVDIDEYANFCKELKELLDPRINMYVVNLDVLPGKFGQRPTKEEREAAPIKGWENMLYLESKGLKVIHVFHQHESFEWLNKLMKHSDYIGVSPANDCSMLEKERWMNQVYHILDVKNSKIKTHGFAVTSHKQLKAYPLFSCDSSSWTAPARFGRIPIFNEKFEMKSFQYSNKAEVIKYWDYIKAVGIDLLASDDYEHRINFAIKSFQKLNKMATKFWTMNDIIWEEDKENQGVDN